MNILKRHPMLFMGLGITLLFLGLGFFRMNFLDTLELKFYDVRMNLRGDPEGPSNIVMVEIDDDSIEKIGRWPWSRSIIASGIEKINAGKPKVIGLNLIYSEPEESSGLKELRNIERDIKNLSDKDPPNKGLIDIFQGVQKSIARLDHDQMLAEVLKDAGNVVLPVFFRSSTVVADTGEQIDETLMNHVIGNVQSAPGAYCPHATEIVLPISAFFHTAQGIGHINFESDMDGTVRREKLIYEYQGLYVPSYTLRLASISMNIPLSQIQADLGDTIFLGTHAIPTTLDTELLINFKGSYDSFKQYSFFDVLNDKIPPEIFKNKIVLLSASASGIMNPLSTPVSPTMSVGELSANTIWAIRNSQFVQAPIWGSLAELLMILVVGILITFIFPRLKAMIAGFSFVFLLIVMLGGAMYLFISNGLWIKVTYPLLQLFLGYVGVISIQYFITETRKEKVEGESAETNRMLGVSFQDQGMLDMAFDKFRRVPVDKEMKDILYNLGLDYERKRQLNKAASVYEYIEEYDPKFKDVTDRKRKLMQVSETMVYGDGLLGGAREQGLTPTGTDTRPTLGRYEVVKQLGKGAMGIVYLGQDPRINRTTAIKTVRFTDDFEPEEAEKLKQTFFQEAESAGTLSHPNIVTIYDAGEEQDLAYIAMEFLEGEDLEAYIKKDNLLPMTKVIEIMADVADGLGYAHEKGIVHRDIKPANIMMLKSGVVKITDFGIARITAASQTQTGVVKGTPFYMSPEQIAGKKVDGRSDIFSLGVTMYQLLTGITPFSGDNMAALMHQIMNEPHPDPRKYNPKIVKPLVTIINNALAKDFTKRYQQATHMATHLRQLKKQMDLALAKREAQ